MRFINDLDNSNVLILNNQAGGGHKSVVEVLTGQLNKRGVSPVNKDILNDIIGQKIGKKCYETWNELFKAEELTKLDLSLKARPIGEFFLGFPAFFKIVHTLVSKEIGFVINPQPFSPYAIVKAVQCANFINQYIYKKKHQIMIYVVVTELPTKETGNYFSSYKHLNETDRKICKLVTTKPFSEDGSVSDEDFWQHHTGFSLRDHEVIYDDLPIREPFQKMANKSRRNIKSIDIEIKGDAARHLLRENNILQAPRIGKWKFKLKPNDSAHAIMLGSQACVRSTIQYVKDYISVNRNNPSKDKQYLFVFCGDHSKKDSLYAQVCKTVQEERKKGNYPKNLIVVPLEGQKANYVAPIFRRSDSSITRSGGLTAMELLAVSEGQIFIHSNTQDLRRGMPEWEAGNAHYLQAHKGAKVITAENSLRLIQAA